MNTKVWSTQLPQVQEFDKSVLYGFAIAVCLIAAGAVLSGSVLQFLDPASFLLVLGGTVGATMVQYSPRDLREAYEAARQVTFVSSLRPVERMREFVRISQRVKQDGLLVLEDECQYVRDPLFKVGLEIAVDGQPEHDIKRILETEIITTNDRSSRAVQVLQTMGTYAPALGLIGTLVGLIQMLSKLNDPASVGPSMSLALVTTLYGAFLANIVFLPIAGKMRVRLEEEALVKAMTVEAVLSISRQESPIILEQRLKRFFPGFRGI